MTKKVYTKGVNRLEKHFRSLTTMIVILLIVMSFLIIWTITHTADLIDRKPATTKPAVTLSSSTPAVIENTGSTTATTTTETPAIPEVIPSPPPEIYSYITVTGGCTYNFTGECLRVHSGPSLDSPVVASLRNDMVLRINPDKTTEQDGHTWYNIIFDETLKYPERNTNDWYVVADYVESFTDAGILTIDKTTPTTSKKYIVVDRSDQSLTAYDGETIFMQTKISTGLTLTPTPRGTFTIFRKTPTRYMQGPLPGVSSQYYDLPGVPWNLYFTAEGAVIHGAYWHNSFGKPYSHGCVNLAPAEARTLYEWADVGITVQIKE